MWRRIATNDKYGLLKWQHRTVLALVASHLKMYEPNPPQMYNVSQTTEREQAKLQKIKELTSILKVYSLESCK